MRWIEKISSQFVFNIKYNNNYRNFKKLQNIEPPYSIYNNKKIINWSNNDYNGLVHNKEIKNEMIWAINKYGCGSSGTRNIGGTNYIHNLLEERISKLHKKDKGLVFNSGYLANLSCMQSLGNIFPESEIFSDEYNHSSIINGIKLSKLNKNIFNHNDINHLEYLLKNKNKKQQKIIIIETLYSIDGSVAPLEDIIKISKKYNCLLFVDEIHAVGVHGNCGGGISDMCGLSEDIDIIMGGFGKGYGLIGGYLTGSNNLINAIRLSGSGFIFTTSLPPHIIYGILSSIDFNKNNIDYFQQERNKNIDYFKSLCSEKKIPLIENNFKQSQIQSIYIGCSRKAREFNNILLNKYSHYVQNLDYPTVTKGEERLRISIKNSHTFEMINNLLKNIEYLFNNYK